MTRISPYDALMLDHANNRAIIHLAPDATLTGHPTGVLVAWPTPWGRNRKARVRLPGGAHISVEPDHVLLPEAMP